VAFEMALQLRTQGQRVSLLALVETLDPTAFEQKDFSRFHNDTTGRAFLQMLTRGAEAWSGRPLGLSVEALQALPPAELWSDVLERLQRHGAFAPDMGVERLHSIRRVFMNAVHNRYVPREAWPERITFIRADASKFCEGALRGGWDKHSPVPVEAHTVPGDHVTAFTEPHVEVLGRTLRTFLERT
jgi:thioesterase domain-containing protein